jgi:uncharacterized protein with FMN-binding domain
MAPLLPPTPPAPRTPEEAALADRLERLAQRRNGTSPVGRAIPDERGRARGSGLDRRPKRRHPAQGARVAALGLSLATTGGLATLFAITNGAASSASTPVAGASVVTGASPAVGAATSVPDAPTQPATDPAAPTADNPASQTEPNQPLTVNVPPPPPSTTTVVDGAVFQNRWGYVQVEATFGPDGSLLDVTALRVPNDRNKSIQINNYAVPRLNAEALGTQSAHGVDTISGATYTSNDYRRSLQSAIDAARAAGVTNVV